MSEQDIAIAVIRERIEDIERRLTEIDSRHDKRSEKLEGNQKWGVMVILGIVAKNLSDFIAGGGQ